MKKVDFIKKARRLRTMFFVWASLVTFVATGQVKTSLTTKDKKEDPVCVAENNGREISEKGLSLLDARKDIVDISINDGKVYVKLTKEAIKKLDADSTHNYRLKTKAKSVSRKKHL